MTIEEVIEEAKSVYNLFNSEELSKEERVQKLDDFFRLLAVKAECVNDSRADTLASKIDKIRTIIPQVAAGDANKLNEYVELLDEIKTFLEQKEDFDFDEEWDELGSEEM